MAIIGIDLGTTNSLAACFIDGEPVVIPNVYGERITPSVVSVDESGTVFVGKIAKERLLSHPNCTASVFKRHMGSQKKYVLGEGTYEKTFTPEELSSFIIKRLKEDSELYLGEPVEEAVVSVPAYFNDAQRRATKLAGELAGLKVERIVNEPTAAAVAYGLHEKRDFTKYIIFDLGGGTFDVSILEKYDNVMEVRAVAGDNFLGGEDFTDVLTKIFIEQTQLDPLELTPVETASIRRAAEIAKREFSNARVVNMSCGLNGEAVATDIRVDEFEKQCAALFTRLREPIKRAISDASVNLKDIETAVLVGGATKLPFIRTFVSRLLGLFPSSSISPDEVVAMGAAIHSAMKIRNQALTEIVLTDVCPYTLGTNISVYKASGFYESGHYCPIIERNSVIPVSRVERLYTVHENQETINVQILQGESRRAAENVPLGELNITVPPAPAGKEAVDVRYTYDVNGILEAEVTVVSTKKKERLIIEKNPGLLSKEEIEKKLAELAGIKIHPRDREEFRFLLARGERMYEESVGDTRKYLEQQLRVFDELLDGQNERRIRDYCEEFKKMLDEIESDRDY